LVWTILRFCKGIVAGQQPVLLEQLRLLDKMTTIAASKDLAAYQGITAMDLEVPSYDDPYDPSDEALAAAEAIRDNRDLEVERAEDQATLSHLFG
jgi:hypothetical protein